VVPGYLTTSSASSTYAPLNNAALTGTPTAPTASANTNSTQIASTAYVDTGLALKANLASPTFTGTVTIPGGASISGYLTTSSASSTYAPLASPTFTGTVTIPGGASISGYLTTSSASSTYAPLASPALTGTPTVPTASPITNSTTAASTAYVDAGTTAAAYRAWNYNITRTANVSWFAFCESTINYNTLALGLSSYIRFFPFRADRTATIDGMALEITSAGTASSTWRMGLYASDSQNLPSGAPVLDTPAFAADATGMYGCGAGTAFNTGTTYAVTKDKIYWVGLWNSSGTCTWRGTQVSFFGAYQTVANSTTLPSTGAPGQQFIRQQLTSYSSSGAMTTASGTASTGSSGNIWPLIYVRYTS
jgi:hypothetical protein